MQSAVVPTTHRYQSLILFLNRRCTVGCATCNVNARPGNETQLSPAWLASFFKKLPYLNFSGYILWTGGEPFFSIQALEKGITIATGMGYHSEILTSGIWYDTHPQWLESLAGIPRTSLRISLDAEHRSAIPFGRLIRLIRSANQLKLQVNFTLRDIPGHPEPASQLIEEIKAQLPDFYQQNYRNTRWLHHIPHMPTAPGTMGKQVPKQAGKQAYKKPCQMVFRDLVVGENGRIYPCCGFFNFPFHRQLSVGDPLTQSWAEIAAQSSIHPLHKILKERGPHGISQELGMQPETWDWLPFQTPCHLCTAIFSQTGQQILEHFRI